MVEQSSFSGLVGRTIGRYHLKQLIERDRFGPVFLANSGNTGPLFRFRLLIASRDLTAEERVIYLGSLQQEANRIAGLRHETIIPLEDFGNYEGMPYLVWPHKAASRSLHAYIAQNGPLDLLTASRSIDQVSIALEVAHQHAILHRSLTTYCIMMDASTVSHQAKVSVAEFGILHMLELAWLDKQETIPPLNVGSEGCAPEQLLGQAADVTTDSYALGAVLYRLLTGHRVFTGKSQEEIIQNILHAAVPPLATWRSNLPASLDTLMIRALAKDPAQRFEHPLELANAFHALAVPQDTMRPSLGISVPPSSPARHAASMASSARPIRRAEHASGSISRRSTLYYIGAGCAVAVVAAFAGTQLLQRTTNNTPVQGAGGTAGGSSASSSIIAHTADVPANSAKTFSIVNQSNPGVLVHLANSNTFVAFDSTCTHEGCAVNYSPQAKLLECPCHGAAFDPAKNAAVVQGPATTPLKSISITVNADGTITGG